MQSENIGNFWGTFFDGLFLFALGILLVYIVVFMIRIRGNYGVEILAAGCILVCLGACLIVFPLEESIKGKDSLKSLLNSFSVFERFIWALYIALGIILFVITEYALSHNKSQVILAAWLFFIVLNGFASFIRFFVCFIKNFPFPYTYCEPSKHFSIIGCIISLAFVIYPVIYYCKECNIDIKDIMKSTGFLS